MTSYDVGGGSYPGGGYGGSVAHMRQAPPPHDAYGGMAQMYGGGIPGLDGINVPRSGHPLPHGSEILIHGVRLKNEGGLPQTDGPADVDDSAYSRTRSTSQVAGGRSEEQEEVAGANFSLAGFPFRCPVAAANRRLPRKGDVSSSKQPTFFYVARCCGRVRRALSFSDTGELLSPLRRSF